MLGLFLLLAILPPPSNAAFPNYNPGHGHHEWVYPTGYPTGQPPLAFQKESSKSFRHRKLNPIVVRPAWTPEFVEDHNNARPRFVENRENRQDLPENARVHTGRLLLPGWESKILDTQHFEDPHYRWIAKANDGNTFARSSKQFPDISAYGTNFIEQSSARVLPVKEALRLRQAMVRRFAPKQVQSASSYASSSSSSSIEAPHYESTPSSTATSARFAQAGLTTGTHAGAKAGAKAGGADPWWLNPPPWWLPPPPEWGSPPPSVYSPFYSPASIQQPVSSSPAHNSYPVYTPTPPPY